MISMHSSTHSSQMNTVGPAMSLRTSCWLFPQKEQYSVLLESPLAALVMVVSHSLDDDGPKHPRSPAPRRSVSHLCRIRAVGCLFLDIPRSAHGSQASAHPSDNQCARVTLRALDGCASRWHKPSPHQPALRRPASLRPNR